MKLYYFLFALFPFALNGQKAAMAPPIQKNNWLVANAEANFSSGTLSVADTSRNVRIEAAKQYLISHYPVLRSPKSGLNFDAYTQSPHSYHISFYQAFDGVDIFNSQVKINVENSNKIFLVSTKTLAADNWGVSGDFPQADAGKLYQILGSEVFTRKKVFFIDGENNPIPAYDIVFESADKRTHEERVYSTNYELLYSKDIAEHIVGKDTTARGLVFFPDPLTSGHISSYGHPIPFENHDDSDIAALDSQRVSLAFPATYAGDTFYLQSKYIIMQDLAAPAAIPAHSATPLFNYKRGNWLEIVNNDTIRHYDASKFNDINVYAHLNRFHSYIRSLGFTGLMDLQLPVDANSNYGQDNSQFIYSPMELWIGTGGVPDAQDADVCVHEYTHALGYSASPNTVSGLEREALDEATSDYMACGYSKAISLYHWQQLFNWDGHNEFWAGRWCVTSMKYEDTIFLSDIFSDKWDAGTLWVGTMMEAQDTIGREKMDMIALEMMYSFFKYETMPQAARLIMRADSTLFGGADVPEIVVPFIRHKILPDSYYKTAIKPIDNGYNVISRYFSRNDLIIVQFNQPESGQADLYDMTGKRITTEAFTKQENANLYVPGISAGIYILTVTTEEGRQAVKMVHP